MFGIRSCASVKLSGGTPYSYVPMTVTGTYGREWLSRIYLIVCPVCTPIAIIIESVTIRSQTRPKPKIQKPQPQNPQSKLQINNQILQRQIALLPYYWRNLLRLSGEDNPSFRECNPRFL